MAVGGGAGVTCHVMVGAEEMARLIGEVRFRCAAEDDGAADDVAVPRQHGAAGLRQFIDQIDRHHLTAPHQHLGNTVARHAVSDLAIE